MRGLAGQGVTGVPDSVLDRSQFGGSGYHQAGNSAGDEPDRATIEDALARNGGIVAQAAAELGLSRQALYRRLERLGIERS